MRTSPLLHEPARVSCSGPLLTDADLDRDLSADGSRVGTASLIEQGAASGIVQRAGCCSMCGRPLSKEGAAGFGSLLKRLRVQRGLTTADLWDRLGKPAWTPAAIEEAEDKAECAFTPESSLRLVEVLGDARKLTEAEAREWSALTGVQPSIVIVHACTGKATKGGECAE